MTEEKKDPLGPAVVKRYEDDAAFRILEENLRIMDPEYQSCIVLGIAAAIKIKGDEILPPDGCFFVTVRMTDGRRIMLTLQEGMLNPLHTQSANRVTPEAVDAAIARVSYCVPPSGKLVLCEIVMDNGFVCTGEAHVLDPANFVFEMGAASALKSARAKVAEIVAYRMQDAIARDMEARGIVRA